MRILIIEDNMKKKAEIEKCVEENLEFKIVDVADNIADAKRLLLKNNYDICFVDLQVPEKKGENPLPESGINLIKEIDRRKIYKYPNHIIVISEYDERLKEIEEEKKLIHTIKYKENSEEWEKLIIDKLEKIQRSSKDKKIVLIAVHGMKTRGEWKNQLSDIITKNTSEIRYCPWDYGSFKLKICSFYHRREAVEKFKVFYDGIVKEESCREINVVAHSFGTYIIYNAMKRYEDVNFDKVIFLGSPLKVNLKWNNCKVNERVNKILFYICKKDWVLSFAKLVCLGDSGKKGFDNPPKNMEYKIKDGSEHSDLFSPKIMRDEWLKFILE